MSETTLKRELVLASFLNGAARGNGLDPLAQSEQDFYAALRSAAPEALRSPLDRIIESESTDNTDGPTDTAEQTVKASISAACGAFLAESVT